VEKAIAKLKREHLMSTRALHLVPEADLAQLIRSSGYFNAKARKLKAFAAHVVKHHHGDLAEFLGQPMEALRVELLDIHGIGPETADDIVLYAAGRPSFVIDAYTRRLLARLGLAEETWPYDRLRALFTDHLPRDAAMFNEYHALIVQHAKHRCRKRNPLCAGCPLLEICLAGQAALRQNSDTRRSARRNVGARRASPLQ
jgi:endonuclease-3 related protein